MTIRDVEAIPLRIGFRETFRFGTIDRKQSNNLEPGIASTAGLHLAAATATLTYPSYLVGPLKYERQISSPEMFVEDGAMPVPDGPGLGIDVDTELLAPLDRRR